MPEPNVENSDGPEAGTRELDLAQFRKEAGKEKASGGEAKIFPPLNPEYNSIIGELPDLSKYHHWWMIGLLLVMVAINIAAIFQIFN